MLDKLAAIDRRRQEVEEKLSDPASMADMKVFAKLNKEYKDLEGIVKAYHEYKSLLENITEAKKILATEKDQDF